MLFFKLWITDCSLLLYQQAFVILKKGSILAHCWKTIWQQVLFLMDFHEFGWEGKFVWERNVCLSAVSVDRFHHLSCFEIQLLQFQTRLTVCRWAVQNVSYQIHNVWFIFSIDHRYSVINYVLTVDWVYCQHLSEKFLCPDQREQKTAWISFPYFLFWENKWRF